MITRKRIVLLGATGSIGSSTLKVLESHSDRLDLIGIAARTNVDRLAKIAARFGVRHVGLFDPAAASQAAHDPRFKTGTQFYCGVDEVSSLATLAEADLVIVAVVGTAGLKPTLAAIEAKKTIALASKEILVLAGEFVTRAAKENGVSILPLDSEHNAIFQCLQGAHRRDVQRIILTASGGSFLDRPLETMDLVTREEALNHPNWSMGEKITIDSATMANKGLELIEAKWLFGLRSDAIDIVIHRQSVIHSMVEFVDGCILAQLSPPSMTFAIQHTLLYPDRATGTHPSLDFREPMKLDFEPPDNTKFPCLSLARRALEGEGILPAAFNAANEIAVDAFLEGRIGFLEIPAIIDKTLELIPNREPSRLDDVTEADKEARAIASQWVAMKINP
jgi:1-deoxy-D-xylulose-5-phosphate reductoisomerase